MAVYRLKDAGACPATKNRKLAAAWTRMNYGLLILIPAICWRRRSGHGQPDLLRHN